NRPPGHRQRLREVRRGHREGYRLEEVDVPRHFKAGLAGVVAVKGVLARKGRTRGDGGRAALVAVRPDRIRPFGAPEGQASAPHDRDTRQDVGRKLLEPEDLRLPGTHRGAAAPVAVQLVVWDLDVPTAC